MTARRGARGRDRDPARALAGWPVTYGGVDGVEAVLLDFDGPVCAVFATLPAREVAAELHRGPAFDAYRVPGEVPTADPIEVLRIAFRRGAPREVLEELDDELARAENAAVSGARPTSGAHAAVRSLLAAGLGVAVVTNNAASCVTSYLVRNGLPALPVVGRRRGRPELLKPDPGVVAAACELLRVRPAGAVLVGDSVSDVAAARSAGVRSVGFATTEVRADRLVRAGAAAVLRSWADADPGWV